MAQINTLIKPTNNCNLRCKYCFHDKYGYNEDILKMEHLKKYITLLSQKYQHINIIWHGGEPLLIPLNYYEEIYNYCEKLNSSFTFSIQTNGTLLNQKIINFFKKNNTNIGLSFDGLENSFTRGKTNKILENISLLKENNIYTGAIIVINKQNVNNLIQEYNYFKSLELSMKLNPMFNEGAATKNKYLFLETNEYINNFIKFFKYWTYDTSCNINVSTCTEIVNLIKNEYSNVCTNNSCLGKWLCFDSKGMIYPCDRLCLNEYNLGNISNITDINEVFCNQNFLNMLKRNINRRNNCINSCEYYNNCYAGCNANYLLHNNSTCMQKEIFKKIKEFINMTKDCLDNMNTEYSKILKR